MHQYKLISQIGQGTFSQVLKAQSLKTGDLVAIKCMKSLYKSLEQVQRLREIQAIKKISPHQNVIQLIEVLYDEPTGRLALVFELMEQNLYESIRNRKTYLNVQKVKHYMYQLLKSIDHMHKRGIFHRDIKPENILLNGEQIKLADFGSCKGIYSQHPFTQYISTRWYRAPECLLTDGYYDFQMDLWGVGCVMFEVLSLFPIFPGSNELDQINRIHNILGTPKKEILDRFKKNATHMEFNFPVKKGTGLDKLVPPSVSKEALDLISKLLIYDPDLRITAEEALKHHYFQQFHEQQRNQSFNSLNSKILNSPLSQKGDIPKLKKSQKIQPVSKFQTQIAINQMNGGGSSLNIELKGGNSPTEKKKLASIGNLSTQQLLMKTKYPSYKESMYVSINAAPPLPPPLQNAAEASLYQSHLMTQKQNPYLHNPSSIKIKSKNSGIAELPKIENVNSQEFSGGDEGEEKHMFPPIKNNSSSLLEKLSVSGLQAPIQVVNQNVANKLPQKKKLYQNQNDSSGQVQNISNSEYLILGQKANYLEQAILSSKALQI